MKFNSSKVKSRAQGTAGVLTGVIAGFAINKIVQEKAPTNMESIKKYAPFILAAAAVAAPGMFDIKGDFVGNVLTGVAVTTGIAGINGFADAKATDGLAALLYKHVPQLGSPDEYYAPYVEPTQGLLSAGSQQVAESYQPNSVQMFL